MKTNLSSYSTRGVDTIARNVVYATRNNSQEDAKNGVLFAAVESESQAYSPLVLKASETGMSTTENAAMRKVKDNYMRLKKMVEANALFPDTEKGKAAVALLPIFKRAGKLYRGKKGDVSSSAENVLDELAKPENTAYLTTLGITAEAQELRASKTEFNNVAGERLNKRSELRQTDNASIGRKKLEKALRNYLAYVNAMREVPGWEDLYSDLNEVMKAARLSVRQGKEPEVMEGEQPAAE